MPSTAGLQQPAAPREARPQLQVGVILDIEKPLESILRTAEAAARYGFDQIWINEHPVDRDPFLVLLAIANRAPGPALGIGTINASARHPAILAASSATLVGITGRRFSLGLGSSNAHLLGPLGLGMEHQVDRCKEAALVIRQLLSGGTCDLEGRVFTIKGAQLGSAQPCEVPLLIGVSGGPRMLAMSGEVADGIIVVAGTHALYLHAIESFREALARAGRSGAEVVVNANVLLGEGADVVRRARDLAAHTIAYRAQTPYALEKMGIAAEDAALWVRQPEQIPLELLRQIVVFGAPEECAQNIRELARMGMTQLVMRMPDEHEVDAFSQQVMPLLAQLRHPNERGAA
jgi:5,10-methylenetetrahydromethanopterin reductase